MLAHHYREALTLAKAAGIDTTPLHAPARAALAEASERAAMLNAWAAAEELADAALALTDPDDPLRPRLQLRLGRAKELRGEPDLELLETACAGFLAQGDTERAGETEALLAWSYWWLGEGEQSRVHWERALELVRDLPVSVPKVRAYGMAARRAALSGQEQRGIDLARETLEMAEALEHDELASHALNTLGVARALLGDLDGLKDLERSIELADRAKAADEMIRSRNNLANNFMALGRLDDATAQWKASLDAAQRAGIRSGVLWADAELMMDSEARGNFADALERADRVLAAADERDQVWNAARVARAKILATLGQIDEALTEAERGLVRAREVADPQHLAPALVGRALVLAIAGRSGEATALLDETLADQTLMRFAGANGEVPLLLAEQGRDDDYTAATAAINQHSTWAVAGTAVARGELGRAADIYAAMGARFAEALARLLAAERGDGGELERAHAYFSEVGAAPYLRRCEALLSASA
jgi:tetratricopeptide (TPR) repeat protein